MPNPRPVAAPRRILVRGVNWLGDAVMTTPALQRLRERFPDSTLTVLSHARIADLWKACRAVDSVLTFSAGENPFAVAQRLRNEDFDTALVLPNSPRSALEVWLAGIPRRIGYARPWRNWFLTNALPPRPGCVPMRKHSPAEVKRLIRTTSEQHLHRSTADSASAPAHQIHEYLFLAAALGADPKPAAPSLALDSGEVDRARAELLARAGAGPDRILLGMNPCAAYGPAKRWPAERFAAAAGTISLRSKGTVWLCFGISADEPLCREIGSQAGVPFINLAGQTSLRDLMRFLAVCQVLLTNDSGPMHVAAALGTPVVVPFGSTAPELTGPGLPGDLRHALLSAGAACSPCFRRTCPIDLRCLTGIAVEQVVTAVLDRVQSRTATASH